MRVRLAAAISAAALAIVLFNITGLRAQLSEPPDSGFSNPKVVEWPLVEGELDGPDFHKLGRESLEDEVRRMIAEAVPGWENGKLDADLVASLKRDAQFLISARVRGDFAEYNEMLTRRGAVLTRAPGILQMFEEHFPPLLPASEWGELSQDKRFALLWSRPDALNAEWRRVEIVSGGIGLHEPEEEELWRLYQRSVWNLPDRDQLAKDLQAGKDVSVAWIKCRITFNERIGDIRVVFIYDEKQSVWLPLLVDYIGPPTMLRVLF